MPSTFHNAENKGGKVAVVLQTDLGEIFGSSHLKN